MVGFELLAVPALGRHFRPHVVHGPLSVLDALYQWAKASPLSPGLFHLAQMITGGIAALTARGTAGAEDPFALRAPKHIAFIIGLGAIGAATKGFESHHITS